MLSARVAAEGVRAVDPGALQGMYVQEEVQDFDVVKIEPSKTKALQEPKSINDKVIVEPKVKTITTQQRKLLFAKSKDKGLDEEQLKATVKAIAGVESTKVVPSDKFDSLLDAIDKYEKEQPDTSEQDALICELATLEQSGGEALFHELRDKAGVDEAEALELMGLDKIKELIQLYKVAK